MRRLWSSAGVAAAMALVSVLGWEIGRGFTPARAGASFAPPVISAGLVMAPTGTPAVDPAAPVGEPAVGPATPAQEPAAESGGTTDGWERGPALQAGVTRAMAGFTGRYSVVVQELGSGQRWSNAPGERYHPASTIKLPVSLYALELQRAGKLDWQQGITYTKDDFESPGGGAFETAPFGGVYPVENLVNRALTYSNNVAVNMLGRYLGWKEIREWTRSIGAELYRRNDSMPEVTPLSELGWWLHLDRLSREDPKAADLLLQPLREVTYDGRIPAGLPEGVSYLHKFGSYDGNYHDGGIVFAERPYIIIVMTEGASVDEADGAIARVSAEVYQALSSP